MEERADDGKRRHPMAVRVPDRAARVERLKEVAQSFVKQNRAALLRSLREGRGADALSAVKAHLEVDDIELLLLIEDGIREDLGRLHDDSDDLPAQEYAEYLRLETDALAELADDWMT
ncbi:hypothetical protein DIPPA_26087 [Diplonema papillatum]|nr:hypothetical protein DIPPA_26087 [Diplonema papillatum]